MSRLYVRFSVGFLNENAQRINLMLYSHTGSRRGVQVRLVTGSWRERRINFANAPSVSSRYVSSGRLRAGAWKAVDVTSLAADRSDDELSFAVTTASTQALYFASRESNLRGPRLVIQERMDNSGPSPGPPPQGANTP